MGNLSTVQPLPSILSGHRTRINYFTWEEKTSQFGSTWILDVAYGSDGYWVAVGKSGKYSYSSDGNTWTAGTALTSNDLTSVVHDGTYWIITTKYVVYVTTDPTNNSFASTATGFRSTTYIYSSAYGNGYSAIGGQKSSSYAKLQSTTTPTSWSTYNTPLTGTTIKAVQYDATNALWVVGGGTEIETCPTDPTGTWTARTSNVSGNILRIAYSDGASIGTTDAGEMTRSTNGTTWTKLTTHPYTSSYYIYAICGDGAGTWYSAGVTTGPISRLAYSLDDGANWLQEPDASFFGATTYVNSIKYNGSYYIAVGLTGKLWKITKT
jgi:hypothetical protein